MPKVAGIEYDYSAEGIAAAKQKAKETGQDMEFAPGGNYDAGGRVKKIPGYFGGGMVGDFMGGYSPQTAKPGAGLGNRPMTGLGPRFNKGGKVKKEK